MRRHVDEVEVALAVIPIAVDMPACPSVHEVSGKILAELTVAHFYDPGDVGVLAAVGSVPGAVEILEKLGPVLVLADPTAVRDDFL